MFSFILYLILLVIHWSSTWDRIWISFHNQFWKNFFSSFFKYCLYPIISSFRIPVRYILDLVCPLCLLIYLSWFLYIYLFRYVYFFFKLFSYWNLIQTFKLISYLNYPFIFFPSFYYKNSQASTNCENFIVKTHIPRIRFYC